MTMTTRRAVLGATAALTVAPAAAFAATSATPAAAGEIRQLWDKVIDLSIRMDAHRHDVADRGTGLPSWMYVSGEANALGNARYDALVQILKSQPRSIEDMNIIARAATHADIAAGPASYASQRLASAALSLQAA